MDTKMIAKSNKKIQVKERLSSKLIKFIQSDKGTEFVTLIGYMPLSDLTKKFGAPDLKRAGGGNQQMNMLLHAVAKAGKGNHLRFNRLIDYTYIPDEERAYDLKREKFVKNWKKEGHQMRLLPYEQYLMNKKRDFDIKTNPNGSFVIKSEPDANPNNVAKKVLLFDKQTGKPIFKWKRKPKGMGLALKLHMYELHKMAKYDKKMAIQEEKDKQSDLFPDQIVAKYKMMREAHLEQLRNDLVDLYCPRKVTVVVQNKNTEEVKKIRTNNVVRLRHCITTRGLFIPDKVKIPTDVRARLDNIARKVSAENNNSKATCIHLTNNRGGLTKLLFPTQYALTA